MHKHIRVRAALCITFIIASTAAMSAQTSLNEDELPTGDVWISHAETVFVPREAPGMVGEMPHSIQAEGTYHHQVHCSQNAVVLAIVMSTIWIAAISPKSQRKPGSYTFCGEGWISADNTDSALI